MPRHDGPERFRHEQKRPRTPPRDPKMLAQHTLFHLATASISRIHKFMQDYCFRSRDVRLNIDLFLLKANMFCSLMAAQSDSCMHKRTPGRPPWTPQNACIRSKAFCQATDGEVLLLPDGGPQTSPKHCSTHKDAPSCRLDSQTQNLIGRAFVC